LAGYAFGFVVAMGLLALRVLPRNQFDMVALWDRWGRRRGISGRLALGRTIAARPVRVEELDSRPLTMVALTPIEELREAIAGHLAGRDAAAAATAYAQLLELDAKQVLARPQQLEIANYLAHARRYREAADAYEAFLAAYPGAADAGPVRLFLGLLYSRYLQEHERAIVQLRQALEALPHGAQRTLAEEELRQAETRLLGPDLEGPAVG
jgi:tetratricopeptide (TPR) repeat protein